MTTNTMTMKGKKLNGKEIIMTTDKMTMKEKKLKNLRKILWILFVGFSALGILFIIPISIIFTNGEIIDTINGINIPFWSIIVITMATTIVLLGGIGLLIYHIFKYRIDKKDDDLFL